MFGGSNAGGFKGTFQADGNYAPYIADIGLRAAIYKLMGKDIPGEQAYEVSGKELVLPIARLSFRRMPTNGSAAVWAT